MSPQRVLLSVGSNIDAEKNIQKAMEILRKEAGLIDSSRIIRTPPDGFQDQDDFLNTAFLLETDLSPAALKTYLQDVEIRLGRVKGPIKSGPRTIDLDIIVWENRIVHSDYPVKDYVRIPVDELLKKHGIRVYTE